MIGISFRFPAGRFHATPWGRHVNEGVPEWPPSPWRLIRAILFAWKVKHSSVEESRVRKIFEPLIFPPKYYLPLASTGHTRHYMRWYKKGPLDQTLVFDTFVALNKTSEVIALWPDAILDNSQQAILSRLLDHLGYLGRAESWCEARLLSDMEAIDFQSKINCLPLDGQQPGSDYDIIRMLCPDPQTAFDNEYVKNEKKKSKRPVYDPEWHLCIETAQLHDERWSDPPGSKWIPYLRKKDCFQVTIKNKNVRNRRKEKTMQIARYVLDSTVLPLVTETLPLAEQARRTVMGIYGRLFPHADGSKGCSEIFSGKDSMGRPLEGHGHAFYLPTDEDYDGRLDHLTIVSTSGFDNKEIRVLDHLRSLKRDENLPALSLMLMGLGNMEEMNSLPLKRSRFWLSSTPFIVTRHLKLRGQKRDTLEDRQSNVRFVQTVLKEELERFLLRRADLQQIPLDDILIEPVVDEHDVFRIPILQRQLKHGEGITPDGCIPFLFGAHAPRPLEFKRYRQRKKDNGGQRPAGSFLITFPIEIQGPLVLGHSSHFGMGLFLPLSNP